MIAFISGQLEMTAADYMILDHDGIGYQIFAPASVLDRLPQRGSEVKVYTYLYVREDNLCLYGFLNREDLALFRLLLTVNSIGPKAALGILSALTADELRIAIQTEDEKLISKAPGIGAKTAKKLILELKDKPDIVQADIDLLRERTGQLTVGTMNEAHRDAILALEGLGYTHDDAVRAVRDCPAADGQTSGDILRMALKKI